MVRETQETDKRFVRFEKDKQTQLAKSLTIPKMEIRFNHGAPPMRSEIVVGPIGDIIMGS